MEPKTNPEENILQNDTIYVDFATPEVAALTKDSISEDLIDILNTIPAKTTRADVITGISNTPEFFKFKDTLREIYGLVIPLQNQPNTCLIECHNENPDSSITILFEQVDNNTFIVRDLNGMIMRTYTYDAINDELWTYNYETRGFKSFRDRVLCNGMFSAACYLVGEAFAIESAGVSLLLLAGFTVASTYIC